MKKTNAKSKETNKLTLAQSLDTILRWVGRDEFEMDDDAISEPKKEYRYVSKTLGIDKEQCELLAAIVELSLGGDASSNRIAGKLGVSNLQFLSRKEKLDDLVEKRLIRSTNGRRGQVYTIPESALRAIQDNRKPEFEDFSGLSPMTLVRRWNSLLHSFWRDIIERSTLIREIGDLLRANENNSIVANLRAFGMEEQSENENLILIYMIVRSIVFGESRWGWEDYGRLFDDFFDEDEIRTKFESGECHLFKAGLVEYANIDGMADPQHVVLTEKAHAAFVAELRTPEKNTIERSKNVILAKDIAEKELFYNEEEQKQVDTLTRLLSQENYENVVARLKEKNLRQGFNVIFWGPAGTGKTETVYQVARRTGRNIHLVDLSEIKSKWVGESEKNIRSIFEEYRQAVRKSKKAPILLFNEADGIFSNRKSGADNAVDKMENTVQNIILQEMENLEGILIATTNLSENLDKAFERRFLYKVHMRKPGKKVKARIWTSMVDGLTETEALSLAADYDFSGGQIENISRKMTINYILTGGWGISDIREMCDSEKLESKAKTKRPVVGFRQGA